MESNKDSKRITSFRDDDAMGECNETVVSLSQCRDIYPGHVDTDLCDKLIDTYDKSGRQLYKLAEAWSRFGKGERRKP